MGPKREALHHLENTTIHGLSHGRLLDLYRGDPARGLDHEPHHHPSRRTTLVHHRAGEAGVDLGLDPLHAGLDLRLRERRSRRGGRRQRTVVRSWSIAIPWGRRPSRRGRRAGEGEGRASEGHQSSQHRFEATRTPRRGKRSSAPTPAWVGAAGLSYEAGAAETHTGPGFVEVRLLCRGSSSWCRRSLGTKAFRCIGRARRKCGAGLRGRHRSRCPSPAGWPA